MKTTLVAVAMCLSGCLLDAQVSFQLSSTLAAGSDPNSIAAVDVNGDGKVDIVCADYYGNAVSVLTNNGGGGFVLAGANPVGSLPIIVTAADFNGDGKVDVACANSGSGSVSVLTNDGSGRFVLSGDYDNMGNATSVTAADVNGDGKVDLITANWDSNAGNTLTVLTNNGSGGFVFASSPVVGQGPDSVMAADVNGDGKVDLISANRVDNTLTVLTNNGSGGFVLSGTYAVGNGPGFVTAADVNGDGKVDLVSANWGNASGNTLTVLTNNGSGRYVFSSTLTVGVGALFAAAADVNGDGTLDLICANNTDETLSVLTNNGVGGFVSAATLSTAGSHPNSVAAADVNGDGKVDLLIPTYSLDTISVFTNATPPVNPPPSCDPAPSGLVAWWPGEGNAYDSIGTNNGALLGGLGFAPGEVGQAYLFNTANNQGAKVAASPALNVGAGAGFTIECWINPADLAPAHPIVEWNNGINNGSSYGVNFYLNVSYVGNLYANIVDSGGFYHTIYTGAGVVASNVFQHVALTYDKASGVARLYYNGTVVLQQPMGSFTPRTTYDLYLGMRPLTDGATYSFAGLMDEVSLYNRALSSNEIAAIYNAGSAGKCPPTPAPPVITMQPTNQTAVVGGAATFSVGASGTPLLTYQWNFNGTNILGATNASLIVVNVQPTNAGSYSVTVTNLYGLTNSIAATLTVNPPPSCDPAPSGLMAWWAGESNANDSIGTNNGALLGGLGFAPGEVGQAFNFNNTSDGVLVAASPSLAPQSLTIETWIYPTDVSSQHPIVEYSTAGGPGMVQLWHSWNNSSGTQPGALFGCFRIPGGGGMTIDTAGGLIPANQWSHVAMTFDYTTQTALLYVNGVNVGSNSYSGPGVLLPETTIPINLGYRPDSSVELFAGTRFAGTMDEVSIYNRALTAVEIQAIYNAGSAGKCPVANHPPVANATATIPLTIAVNGSNATVVLGGSLSFDPDGDALQYTWFNTGSTNALTNGIVAVVVLPVGTNSITLMVSDGLASDSQTITVEVITPAQAINRLIADAGDASAKQSLLATLRAALASIDRSNPTAAVNQLQAFQNQVNAQLGPIDPTSAQMLIDEAQLIIDSITGDAAAHGKVNITSKANGKPHLKFSAPKGQIYIIEASSDLVNWEKIGVAKDQGDGTFDFDDNQSGQTSARYYRITVP